MHVSRSINERTISFPLCGSPNTVTRGGGGTDKRGDSGGRGGTFPPLGHPDAGAVGEGGGWDGVEKAAERLRRSASNSAAMSCNARRRDDKTSPVPQNGTKA